MRQVVMAALVGTITLALVQSSPPSLKAQRPDDPRRDPFAPRGFDRGFPGPGGRPPISPILDILDTNRDGEISNDEIRNAPAIIKKLDRNGDGQITADELAPPGGPGRPGGPSREKLKLVKQFDKNKDKRLDAGERRAARDWLATQQRSGRGGRRRFGPPGGRGPLNNRPPATPGQKVSPAEVKPIPDAPLYDRTVLRTLFLEFENKDWEEELADFKDTDVEVTATLTVDGKRYPDVGVRFRGNSSYRAVSAGYKRSLNLSLDFVNRKQRLYGYKTLNLLNSMGDPTMMSTVLYSHLAETRMPVPKANFVKVVINGRSWGIYANTQQFNKEFVAEHFGSAQGARWKVNGSPRADGGMRYLGENVADYRQRYEIKSKDRPESWQALISLCRTLEQTPPAQLEQALRPILDVDELLWFLAFDVVLINNDGYWTRASDYSIFQDVRGRFHIIAYDMNEAFRTPHRRPGGSRPRRGFGPPGDFPGGRSRDLPDRGPRDARRGNGTADGDLPRPGGDRRDRGFSGPPGGPEGPGDGDGIELDPLVSIDDPRMALRSKVLAVPNLRRRYLENVRTIAATSLDWKTLGPVVQGCRSLIEKEIKADTRKLDPFEAFLAAMADEPGPENGRGRGRLTLRGFIERRRQFLLQHPEIASLPRDTRSARSRQGADASPLPNGRSRSRSAVVINEIMAANDRTVADPEGNFEDWIELFNRGDRAVNLSGFSLSDSRNSLDKWSFPKDTVIPARGFLVIWADKKNRSTRGLHANFRLSRNGETVFFSKGSTILDQVEFGRQASETALGQSPDGQGNWRAMQPSPGKANRRPESK
ncbi:MAG: spore coat protein CotH [Planctomycetaceae bacterium]|nr:spore coat protein CotH [Planctomycetaceae bacterium]